MKLSKCVFLLVGVSIIFHSCSKDPSVLTEGENQIIATDLTARDAATALFQDYYTASTSDSSDVAWSGDEPSCTPGDVPQNTKDKIFMRLDYFRKAVGLNNVISESSTKSEKAQHAALMMKSNGTLDHFPPDTWSCYTSEGNEGAANSLLTQTKNAEAIDSYMRDAGEANGPVGHRRWLLWPRLQEIGVGNTNTTNAIWVLGNAGSTPTDAPEFIAWPPKGYTPKQLVYERWSFSIAGADFSETTISVKDRNNQNISVAVEELSDAFGDPTMVWRPSINVNTLNADALFSVLLQNVAINGQMQDFEYEVILFDVNS